MLPRVWETAKLHEDIERGEVREAHFAVEFGPVVLGSRGVPKVYADTSEFFSKTYKTSDIGSLLVNALKRVARGSGSPVAVVSTEFGGGKTHALIALHHTFLRPSEAKPHLESWEVLREADVPSPPRLTWWSSTAET